MKRYLEAPVSPHEIYAARIHAADARYQLGLLTHIATYLASGLTKDFVARDRSRRTNIMNAIEYCAASAETIWKGVVFAFHDDLEASKGTADMVRRAVKAGLPVYNIRRMSESGRAGDPETP